MPPARGSERYAGLVAAGILLSRVAGLVRERAIGHFLGAGLAVEAFRAALRIPNLLQNLLGEGVLSASFIPVHSRLLAQGDHEGAARLAGAVAGFLAVIAGGLAVVGVVFARPLAAIVAVGWGGEKLELTVTLMQVLTPGAGLLVLSAWCLGVLNSHRQFFLSYVAPVLWNAAMIAALVAGALTGLSGASLAAALAWGTLVGSAVQFAVQLPKVLSLSPGLRPSLQLGVPGLRTVMRGAGPVILGRGVVQVLAYVQLLLASLLAAGAVAALTYAQVLFLLPVSIFGMSVAAAELPGLSSGDIDTADLRLRLRRGIDRITFYVLPASVAYLVIGDRIVALLYQSGRFDRATTVQVWIVLAAYSLGLLATTWSRLLQSVFYGAGDTRTPATIAAVRVAISSSLGLALMLQFDAFRLSPTGLEQIAELPVLRPFSIEVRTAAENLHRLGAVGLSLAAGLGAWVELVLLRRRSRTMTGKVALAGPSLSRVVGAAAVAALAGLAVRFLTQPLGPVLAGLASTGVFGVVYLGAAWLLEIPEVRSLRSLLRR